MFTDIEGSSPLMERLGDAGWLELLRVHNALVRELVTRHSGVEVRTTGDGFMLRFSRPESAVACAIAIQRALADHGRRNPERALHVRMGLHSGHALALEGDFYGRDVVVAARVSAAACGDEILVSASLVGQIRDRACMCPLGPGRPMALKGLSAVSVVHSVLWAPVPLRWSRQTPKAERLFAGPERETVTA